MTAALESGLAWLLDASGLTRDALLARMALLWALAVTGWLLGRLFGKRGRR